MVEELTRDQLVRGLVRIGEKEMIAHLEKLETRPNDWTPGRLV